MASFLSRGALGALAFSTSALAGVALSAGPGAAASVPEIVHAVRQTASDPIGSANVRDTWASSNWSGYAETGTFAGVSGTWTVPSVSATSSSTYSAAWIGVDGYNNDDLIQTGTEQDYYSGATHYDAWWEILPASETVISTSTSYLVSPGDRMSASIYETSATVTSGRGFRASTEHEWSITISDTTKGWSFNTTQAYGGPGASAEWIVEAPEICSFRCSIASLAHYTFTPPSSSTGDFDNAGVLTSVVSSGGSPSYTNAGLNYQNDSGVMIQNGAQVSTPGYPDSPALSAFDAAYGSSLPSTPTS